MKPIPTAAVIGLEAYPVSVEADIAWGMPAFTVVGLPDTAVQEARERVRSAMKRSDLEFPRTRVTVNLAPADLRKAGSGYDLPIALALLAASDVVREPKEGWPILVGELALDGSLRPIRGALSIALHARKTKNKELVVPIDNAKEASLVPEVKVFAASSLLDVFCHLVGEKLLEPQPALDMESQPYGGPMPDFSGIRGQEQAKRALEIAAAGGHNVLLSGPPGSGKTMLARAFPGILPDLTREEVLEVTQIYSVAGILPREGCCRTRPFRSPHHTASGVALVGGGTVPRPGEISLAHRGILFLDEFPEFPRQVLENLRQPLEDGMVSVSRAQGSICFPARFTLIAAMNPCPCGFSTDPERTCTCTAQQLLRYTKRISGPLIDRIDLKVHVPRVPTHDLVKIQDGENSESIRSRVQKARDKQSERKLSTGVATNAELTSENVRRCLVQTPAARQMMRKAADRYKLSARAYFRVLRVAQTIADLGGSDEIDTEHTAESLQFRQETCTA